MVDLTMAERIEQAREGYAWGMAHQEFDSMLDLTEWPVDKWCAALAAQIERCPSEGGKLDPERLAEFVETLLCGVEAYCGSWGKGAEADEARRSFEQGAAWALGGLMSAAIAGGVRRPMEALMFFGAIQAAPRHSQDVKSKLMVMCVDGGEARTLSVPAARALMEGFKIEAVAPPAISSPKASL